MMMPMATMNMRIRHPNSKTLFQSIPGLVMDQLSCICFGPSDRDSDFRSYDTGNVPRMAVKSGYTNVQYLGRIRCGGIAVSGDPAQANSRVVNWGEGGTQDVVSR